MLIAAFVLMTFQSAFADSGALPSLETQLQIFDTFASEMSRLDGEALLVRGNRRTSWTETTQTLRNTIARSGKIESFAEAMYRLDAAYPNLHSFAEFGPELRDALPPTPRLPIRFAGDWEAPERVTYRVVRAEEGAIFPPGDEPARGDRVVAINGRAMASWANDSFQLCKFPLKAQCDAELDQHFFERLLPSDTRRLSFTLSRGNRTWTVEAALLAPKPPKPRDDSHLLCRGEPDRYPGFTLTYGGSRACVFESPEHPSTAILRITGFSYRRVPETEPIHNVWTEVEALYPWWKDHAKWEHLVVDLIDNGGGQETIPYYQILFQRPFQEQYFRLRKMPELLDERIRAGIFWDTVGQEIWFQQFLKSGEWDRLAEGDFLPPIPMFCADPSKICTEGLTDPREHPFRGRVSVLLNRWCVSSCDAVAYTLREQLGDKTRYFGQPQAADTAYSRLTMHAVLNPELPKGFELKLRPIQTELEPAPFISQTVTVSRSVTATGEVVSGIPVPLDQFVPETLANRANWQREVLNAALAAPQ